MTKTQSSEQVRALNYEDFLTGLLAFGSRLPVALPVFMEGVNDFQLGVMKFDQGVQILLNQPAPPPNMANLAAQTKRIAQTDKSRELEAKVVKLIQETDPTNMPEHQARMLRAAAIDPSKLLQQLQAMFMAVINNPQLLAIIMQLLGLNKPKTTPEAK